MADLNPVMSVPDYSVDIGASASVKKVLSSSVAVRLISLAVVLVAWEIIGVHYPYSMSYPSAVAIAVDHYFASEVLPAFGQTLESFGIAYGICVFAGIPIGLLMARVKIAQIVLEPYVVMFYSLPMLAIFPLLIVAFGINFELRVAACVLFGIFSVITNTFIGASRIDPALEDVSRTFVASRRKSLTTIIIPGSADYIFAGLRVGFGHAMIGAIVIEMEASVVGLGSLLQQFAHVLNLAGFFVVVVSLGIFSILYSVALRALQRWATEPWNRSHRFGGSAVGKNLARMERALSRSGPVEASRSLRRLLSRVSTTGVIGALRRGAGGLGRPIGKFLSKGVGIWLLRLLVAAAIVAFWQAEAHSVSRAVLASPWTVAKAIGRMFGVTHAIYAPMLTSLSVFGLGFGLSLAIGIPVGLIMGRSRTIELALDPYVSFLYALPLVVFVPLMVIWLGFGFNFGVAFVVVSAVFVVIINTMQGVHSVDRDLVMTARSFCASERDIVRTVVIPSVIPFVIAGARMAFSISWIGVIVEEVISSQTGLGGMINKFATYFEIPTMFVPIFVIIAISVVIVGLSNAFLPRLTPWFEERKR